MTTKLKVPRSRIPKVFLKCLKCEGGVATTTGSPYAEGYHRRHSCKNPACGYSFYSLVGYDAHSTQVSPLPFEDRPLSPWEQQERERWWQEEFDMSVTLGGNHIVKPAEPFMQRFILAIGKPEGDRTPQEVFMVEMYTSMKEEVEKMDEEGRTAGLLRDGLPDGSQPHGDDDRP